MDSVLKIKQFMHEMCHSMYTIQQLCDELNISYHTMRKKFRKMEGMSLLEYWQICRLQKAEELLLDKDKYIFEVAYEMGFSSDGNFSKWFKNQKGITPKEFREAI